MESVGFYWMLQQRCVHCLPQPESESRLIFLGQPPAHEPRMKIKVLRVRMGMYPELIFISFLFDPIGSLLDSIGFLLDSIGF